MEAATKKCSVRIRLHLAKTLPSVESNEDEDDINKRWDVMKTQVRHQSHLPQPQSVLLQSTH